MTDVERPRQSAEWLEFMVVRKELTVETHTVLVVLPVRLLNYEYLNRLHPTTIFPPSSSVLN